MAVSTKLLLFRRQCTVAVQLARYYQKEQILSSNADHSLVETEEPGIIRGPLPIITSRELAYPPKFLEPRQSWVENLDTIKSKKLGIVNLHPEVFGAFPRLDLLYANVVWQRKYKTVNWDFARTRAEMPGGGRKPWAQKGLGKARAGSVRAPTFTRGGKAHGPRGPKTGFFMLPFHTRVKGLISALSAKFAQDDLKIVDSLEISSTDSKFVLDMIDHRDWGPAVLFVDDTDVMPKNITIATEGIKHMILMPAYGLNVYSMLKYHTLVLTVKAVDKIENRILHAMNRLDYQEVNEKFRKFF